MKKTYKLHYKLLKKVLKENLFIFLGFIFLGFIFGLFSETKDAEYRTIMLLTFVGVMLLLNLQTIILLIDYYVRNKETIVEIDTASKYITISKKGHFKKYEFSEIETSTYHLGIYYKQAIDNWVREYAIHSDFGYWDLKFKNGDRYYISNLIVDFLHEYAFIKKTKYRFRFFPYINTSNSKKAVKLKRAKEKTNIEKFVEKFQSKNEKQLREILDNKTKYQKDAVKAAEIVLKRKNIDNNQY
ncbi:hypothetical protein [Kordia antarctica]|uniref:hypothetical protein n=1 Tax=Kordia antarctica TaxID=1218801 RepID=UPI00135BB43D|nr:hypothetical protein [Kordia antarctica]